MGRKIRRVANDWQHPKRSDGSYKPLLEPNKPICELQADWDRNREAWENGTHPECHDGDGERRWYEYDEWDGARPVASDYMPWWPEEQRTHWQMYEDTSEGTPISPVLESPEAVARWCAVNGASRFGSSTATYEEWLYVARGGFGGMMFVVRGA